MTNVIDELYDYAQETMMSDYLGEALHYLALSRRAQASETALREALGEQGIPLLEGFMEDQYRYHDQEVRALFRCALAIGLELGRL